MSAEWLKTVHDSPELATMIAAQDSVQALLAVLNDTYGSHPWNHNVITEAGEMAAAAAVVPIFDLLRARLTNFGGLQRTRTGEFWVARDDVMRLLNEVEHAVQMLREATAEEVS